MSESPNKKIILITGCSSGFGMLCAVRLATQGHHVYATMRNLDKQSELLSELKIRDTTAEILELDVTVNETIKKAMHHIASKHGHLDILINNAGYGIGGAFEDLTDEDIRSQMETNFFGVLNVTREAIPLMRQRRQGKIINISSVAGFSASPFFSAYNCSKFALEAFSESLRYELQLFGIDVLLVQPGTYKTKIFYENRKYAKNFDNPESPYFPMSQHLKNKVSDYVESSKKNPEDVAELVSNLIVANKSKFRNIPDIETRIMAIMRKILPFSLYSWIIKTVTFKGLNNY